MSFCEELSPEEKAEMAKAHQRWVEDGCPMPTACYYGSSPVDLIQGVQPMKEHDDGER